MTGQESDEAVQSGVLKLANNGEKRLLMEKDGIAREDFVDGKSPADMFSNRVVIS